MISAIYSLVLTDWGELCGAEGARDVVHSGLGEDLPISTLSSFPSFFIGYILSSCFYSSSSLEERDRGRIGGGGGEDRFAVDCGEKGKTR